MTLHREYFDAIADGTKRIEYRERKPYWRTRLEGRHYDIIHFRNGYSASAPEIWVEFKGLRRCARGRKAYYAIQLGRVLKIRGWKGKGTEPSKDEAMARIRTKSVYEPIHPRKDGLRILATRVRGRGLPSNRYDVWMANLGPSEALLRAMQGGRITWAEFRRRYRKELFEGGSIDRRNRTIRNHGQKFTLRLLRALAKRGPITLMCHCPEDERHCHRHLLQKILLARG